VTACSAKASRKDTILASPFIAIGSLYWQTLDMAHLACSTNLTEAQTVACSKLRITALPYPPVRTLSAQDWEFQVEEFCCSISCGTVRFPDIKFVCFPDPRPCQSTVFAPLTMVFQWKLKPAISLPSEILIHGLSYVTTYDLKNVDLGSKI